MDGQNEAAARGHAGGAWWVAALSGALLLVAAFPRQGTRQGEPSASGRTLPTGAASPSHTGKDAQAVAAREADRGRQAASPQDIPAKGWKDIGLRVYRSIGEDRVLLIAAGVTHYAILAIFPALAALVAIYGLIADAGTINNNMAALQGVVPGGALEIVGEQVKRITAKGGGTLGLALVISVALSLWSANGGMKAVFDALNIVYKEREKRNFLWLNLRSLTFTAGALGFIVLALIGIVAVPIALNFLGLSSGAWLLALLRWPALLVIVLGGLALLYRYGPSRDTPRWRWVTWGSGAAALGWIVTSGLFSWYVSNFGKYNETYGSLGAAIGFMTWIWISTAVILLGAEINAEMEHQTERDTTVGPEEPLGARRAEMADTVGKKAA